jgi:hypothetical protein
MTEQLQPQFTEILDLIKNTQNYVIATSNQELIKLYWSIGQYIDAVDSYGGRSLGGDLVPGMLIQDFTYTL